MARQQGSSPPMIVDNNSSSALQLTCEHVFGVTSTSSAAFVSHKPTGLIAYAAGCIIVVVDSKLGNQSRIINSTKKEVVSLCFSNDGKFIASGESGHKPSVRVWEVATGQPFGQFNGHDNAVPFVAFSPDDKFLVSVGNQFDNTINVWNWRKKEKVSSTKNTAEVRALVFPPGDSRHFLTVGKGHAKFWHVEEERSGRLFLKGVVPYGSIAKKIFSSAVYTDHSHVVAAYARSLCKFSIEVKPEQTKAAADPTSAKASNNNNGKENKEKEAKEKWILRSAEKTLDAKHIFCLAVDCSAGHLFVGCENGAIKVVDAKTLLSVDPDSLPKPHRLDNVLENKKKMVAENSSEDIAYPDTIALSWIDGAAAGNHLLAAVYSDHSIYVWDVTNLSQVRKVASWPFHACRILGLDVYPNVEKPVLPADSFATCAHDGTIRLWKAPSSSAQELIDVLYCEGPVSAEPLGNVANCISFSPDGRELAAGFRNGSVRVYDLTKLPKFSTVKANSAEPSSVLVLEYSRFTSAPNVQLMACGGCDGYILVFNAASGYWLHQSLKSLQSSAINGLRFAMPKSDPSSIWLICSSQDKSIRLYGARISPDGLVGKFDDGRQIVLPCSPHDIEINDQQTTIAVGCHDRLVRLFDIQPNNNEPLASYLGAGSNDGTLKRLAVDSTGSLMATICSDKTVTAVWRTWDYQRKDRTQQDRILATSSGHSEQMSGVKFLPNSQRFITVAADSCIFVWKAPSTEAAEQNLQLRWQQASTIGSQSDVSSPVTSRHKADRSPSSGGSAKSRTPSNSSIGGRSKNSSLSSSSSSAPTSTPSTSPTSAKTLIKPATPSQVTEPVVAATANNNNKNQVNQAEVPTQSQPQPVKLSLVREASGDSAATNNNRPVSFAAAVAGSLKDEDTKKASQPAALAPAEHTKPAASAPSTAAKPVAPVTAEPSPKEQVAKEAKKVEASEVASSPPAIKTPPKGQQPIGDEDKKKKQNNDNKKPEEPRAEINNKPTVQSQPTGKPVEESTEPKPAPVSVKSEMPLEPPPKTAVTKVINEAEQKKEPTVTVKESATPAKQLAPANKQTITVEPKSSTVAQPQKPASKDSGKRARKTSTGDNNKPKDVKPSGTDEPVGAIVTVNPEKFQAKFVALSSSSSESLLEGDTANPKPNSSTAVTKPAEVILLPPVPAPAPAPAPAPTTATKENANNKEKQQQPAVAVVPAAVIPVVAANNSNKKPADATILLPPPPTTTPTKETAKNKEHQKPVAVAPAAAASNNELQSSTTIDSSDNVNALASEFQELSARLVHELHTSPGDSSTASNARRRLLEVMFVVRRQLDEYLEQEFFKN